MTKSIQKPISIAHKSTLLIGSGRLAKHLAFYCSKLGWNLGSGPSLSRWTRADGETKLKTLLSTSTQVWLAISDSEIEKFHKKYLKNYTGDVIHFSGALEIPGLSSVHPLMTFSENLYDLDFYKSITWVCFQKLNWERHFPGFPNKHLFVRANQKTKYHLLCVMCGNFTQILLNTVQKEFSALGVPMDAWELYLQKSVDNFFAAGKKSLTGPFARKDHHTISTHLEFLSEQARQNKKFQIYKNLYQDFFQLYESEG